MEIPEAVGCPNERPKAQLLAAIQLSNIILLFYGTRHKRDRGEVVDKKES